MALKWNSAIPPCDARLGASTSPVFLSDLDVYPGDEVSPAYISRDTRHFATSRMRPRNRHFEHAAAGESESENDGIARKSGPRHSIPRHRRGGDVLLQVHNACSPNRSSSPLPRIVHADSHTPRHRAVREHRRYMGETPELLQRRRAGESRMYTTIQRRHLLKLYFYP